MSDPLVAFLLGVALALSLCVMWVAVNDRRR